MSRWLRHRPAGELGRRWCVIAVDNLAPDAMAEVGWSAPTERGRQRMLLGEVGQLPCLDGRPVHVVLPGTGILQAFATLPSGGRSAQGALPWLVEPFLLNDVDDNHVVWRRDALHRRRYRVWICSRHWRGQAARLLEGLGLTRVKLVPLHGLLPIPSGGPCLQWLGRHRCFVDDAGSGVLPGTFAPRPDAEVLEPVGEAGELFDWAVNRLATTRLPMLTSSDVPAQAAPRRAIWAASWGAWAMLAALLVADGLDLRQQAQRLAAQSEQRVQAAVPGLHGPADRHWRKQLSQWQTAQPPPPAAVAPEPLASRLGRLAQAATGADVAGQLVRLDYREGELTLTASMPALEDASALRNALEAAGYAAQIVSARGQAELVIAELNVALPSWSG